MGAYGAGLATMLVYQYRTAISDAKELAHSAAQLSKPSPYWRLP